MLLNHFYLIKEQIDFNSGTNVKKSQLNGSDGGIALGSPPWSKDSVCLLFFLEKKTVLSWGFFPPLKRSGEAVGEHIKR